MKTSFIRMVSVAAIISLAACGPELEVDAQLRADLQAASAGGIELAPMGAPTRIVSGVEQVKRATPRPTAPRPKARPAESERTIESRDPAPSREPRVAQPTAANPEPVATRPSSAPRVQPAPPGGYKTVDEIIRNAPFPIKP